MKITRESYKSHIDRFHEAIDGKTALWGSLIDSSNFDIAAKEKYKEILRGMKNTTIKVEYGYDDLIYYTISQLLTHTEKIKREHPENKEEAGSLFANLRDDLWKFSETLKI